MVLLFNFFFFFRSTNLIFKIPALANTNLMKIYIFVSIIKRSANSRHPFRVPVSLLTSLRGVLFVFYIHIRYPQVCE